jgi:hypothetical protein
MIFLFSRKPQGLKHEEAGAPGQRRDFSPKTIRSRAKSRKEVGRQNRRLNFPKAVQ